MTPQDRTQLNNESLKIAEAVYLLIEGLPDDEKGGMHLKLRYKAVDYTSAIAEAVQARDRHDAVREYAHARMHLASIKNLSTLAKRVGYIDIDPEFMQLVNHTAAQLDDVIAEEEKVLEV